MTDRPQRRGCRRTVEVVVGVVGFIVLNLAVQIGAPDQIGGDLPSNAIILVAGVVIACFAAVKSPSARPVAIAFVATFAAITLLTAGQCTLFVDGYDPFGATRGTHPSDEERL